MERGYVIGGWWEVSVPHSRLVLPSHLKMLREGRTGAGLATCSRVFVMCVFTTSLPLGVSAERGATCCSTVRVLLARQCQQCGY